MRRRGKLVSEINITPFTDVILVLLVIFMITTPLIGELNIRVNLPETKSGTAGENTRQAQANIIITQKGIVYLDGKPVTRAELKEKVDLMHRNNPDLSVIVHSDRAVQFQKIVDVLDPLSELGVSKLNIAATVKKEE